jgi:hypothetical protein
MRCRRLGKHEPRHHRIGALGSLETLAFVHRALREDSIVEGGVAGRTANRPHDKGIAGQMT